MTTISQSKGAAASTRSFETIIRFSGAIKSGRISKAKKIADEHSITPSDQYNVAMGVLWMITQSRKEPLPSRIMDNQYLVFGLMRKERVVSRFMEELRPQVAQSQQREFEEARMELELRATLDTGKHAIVRLRRNIT